MSGFMRYPHLVRFGDSRVNGIEDGECWVFPKLDGTNASLWYHDLGEDVKMLKAGSRNRILSLDSDNAGFLAWAISDHPKAVATRKFMRGFPYGTRFYGEWLVPHTIKTYREDAWQRFWIFDVFVQDRGFVPYDEYSAWGGADAFEVDLIAPFAKIKFPTEADLFKFAEGNTFLMADGSGVGEGVVLKRYGFADSHGHATWAKLVLNKFKEDNRAAFGVADRDGSYQPELDIAQHAITQSLVSKERAKIELDLANKGITDGAARKILIPRLLGTMYHVLVVEELWSELKRLNNPTIDFRKLQRFVTTETKKHMGDLL